MGIKIGDDNKIQNSMIAEKIDTTKDTIKKKTFFDKHPVICGFLTLKPQFLRNKLTPRESSNSCVFFWMAETLIPWPSPVSTR